MIFVRVQNSPDSRQCDNKIRSFPKESGAEKKTKSGCTIAHGFVHHIRFLDLLQPLLASADPCDNVGHSKQREKKSSRDRPSDRCTMNIKENRQVREQKREKKKGHARLEQYTSLRGNDIPRQLHRSPDRMQIDFAAPREKGGPSCSYFTYVRSFSPFVLPFEKQ